MQQHGAAPWRGGAKRANSVALTPAPVLRQPSSHGSGTYLFYRAFSKRCQSTPPVHLQPLRNFCTRGLDNDHEFNFPVGYTGYPGCRPRMVADHLRVQVLPRPARVLSNAILKAGQIPCFFADGMIDNVNAYS